MCTTDDVSSGRFVILMNTGHLSFSLCDLQNLRSSSDGDGEDEEDEKPHIRAISVFTLSSS